MTTRLARKNEPALRYVTAVMFAVAAFGVLRLTPFFAPWLTVAGALALGALALVSAPTAALALAVVGSLPIVAADLVVGVSVMILALVGTQYLATGRATGFLLVALAAVLVPLRAEWAIVALSGYLLGRGRGALAAGSAAAAIMLAGLLTGAPTLGTLAAGGQAPGLIDVARIAGGALSFEWLTATISAADPDRVLRALRLGAYDLRLLAQPLIWAGAAALGGAIGARPGRISAITGALASLLTVSLGGALVWLLVGSNPGPLAVAAAASAVVALVVTLVAEAVFPRQAPAPVAVRGAGAEEADVDELLRVIASAEDELAARHRTEAVVLITDMKSFSAMTEDLGSLDAAKMVQRHRDLLLPVVERHHGKGKSTGGDGLVAAFDTAGDAVAAAIEMQRELERLCETDRVCAELLVRIGIADGEVVLDKGGRPFLGAALNLAARVMDLADGGRIMTTAAVASALGEIPSATLYRHGEFKLKNIAEPLGVFEVLWRDGLEPQEIRAV